MSRQKFELHLSKSVCIAVFLAALLGRGSCLCAAYLAATLHEGAHLAVCVLLSEQPESLNFTLFGMRLQTNCIFSPFKKILISLAGPFASLVLFSVCFLLQCSGIFTGFLFEFFMLANLGIGLVNLIPTIPLDGGTVLKSLLISRFGIITGARLQRNITKTVSALALGTSGFLFLMAYSNITLLLISIFLIYSFKREQETILLEKKKVLTGEISSSQKIRYIAAEASSELLSLASCISPSYTIITAVFENGRFIGDLTQSEIVGFILRRGALTTVKDCLHQRDAIQRKTECEKPYLHEN